MASLTDTLTKREFLEASTLILKPVLNPQLLRSALATVIAKFEVPDDDALLAELLGPEINGAVSQKGARNKAATDMKEKGKNRTITAYQAVLCWLSDFAANYGRHPTIVKVKAENPTKKGLAITSELFKSFPKEKKEEVCKVMADFRAEQLTKGETDGSLSNIEALKKFEAEHPEIDVGHILGLEARPDYKTDPAQMRAEAAEARRHADGKAGPVPTATPTGVAMKLDFEQGKEVDKKHTLEVEAPEPERASVQKKQKAKAAEVVPMEEEPDKLKEGEKSEKKKRREREEKEDGHGKDKEDRKSEKKEKKKRKDREDEDKSVKKEKKHKEKKNKEKHDDH